VRGTGAGRCLLCAGARRGRLHAGVLLRGRCPAGGRLRLCAAALPTRKARFWHPAGRFCRGGGAGRAALRPPLPRGSGLRHGGCCPLLPWSGKARAGLCCLHRGRALRSRSFPCPGSGGALLRHSGSSPAGPRAAGRDPCRLCGRVCAGGALCSRPRHGSAPAPQRRAGLCGPRLFPKTLADTGAGDPRAALPPPPGWKQWPRAFPRWPRR